MHESGISNVKLKLQGGEHARSSRLGCQRQPDHRGSGQDGAWQRALLGDAAASHGLVRTAPEEGGTQVVARGGYFKRRRPLVSPTVGPLDIPQKNFYTA